MKKKKVACLFVCAMLCALALPASTRAQTVLASVTGLVLDPNSAAIVEAKVTAKNVDTGIETIVQTNSEGLYHFANLEPGNYEFSVSKRGFKVIVKPGVTLHVVDTLSMNFTMQVGDVKETVTVEAGAPMVNTTDASVSTVVDQTYVKNMPLNGRSFQDLILLTPGIVTQTSQSSQLSQQGFASGLGQSGEFSVNGQRGESNYYTVDGVSANVGATSGLNMVGGAGASGSLAASTALGTTQALVSVDALQEFRVQSSTYSAEYGRNPGGQFAFETKSGTNEWHGTAYDYLRNGAFDAKDWFNDYFDLPEPPIKQNDFGVTLGGPLKIPRVYNGKDKTFFFVSYEALRLTAPQPAAANDVPDLCLRGIAANCTGTHTPAPPALQPVLNAFPVPSPSGLDFGDGIGQFIGSWSNPSSINSTSARFDHTVNSRLRLFFRFSNTLSDSSFRGISANQSSPTALERFAYTLRTYTTGANTLLSTHVNNEFRLNFSSNDVIHHKIIDAFAGSTPINLVQLTGLTPGSGVGVALTYDQHGAWLGQGPQSGAQRQWNLVDTVALSSGRHQVKLGVDFRRLAPFEDQANPRLSYFFNSESEVEGNSPSQTFADAFAPAYPLYKNFSAFAQDEWRIAPRLSLSFGLRWEVNPAPGVTQGLKPYTLQGAGPDTWSVAPQATPLWRTTWYNFAPRLGVAYLLHNVPGLETVVRGGGGLFFDTGQQLGSLGFDGPGFSAEIPGPSSFPGVVVIPSIVNPPTPMYLGVPFGFGPHLQLPYTLQWNASVEQALGKSQALTVSYVGSHAGRLLREDSFVSFTNPNTSFFGFIGNGLTSDFDSLQVQLRRRLSQGLTALASYTWSHCMDYGSENYNTGYQRGNCDVDVRHNFSGAFSYDIPNVGHNGFLNAVLHHWGLDSRLTARTAFPITLQGNLLFQPNGQIYFGGLDLVPGQPIYLYGSNCASVLQGLGDLQTGKGCPADRAINPNAFTAVGSGVGNAPRNVVRGFGAWQGDVAVRRDFPMGEKLKLQFRVEAFNTFNHPNFGAIDSGYCPSGCTFGQARGTLASSLGILNPLYQMGGPRSMQFTLKIVF